MREFSFVNAWGHGLRFFEGQGVRHAIILIVIGALVPFVPRLLLAWQVSGAAASVEFGASGIGGGLMAATLALTAAGYVLATGSYFASWRLGLDRNATMRGAIGYGVLAGLLMMIGLVAVFALIGFVATALSPAIGFVVGIVALLLLLAVTFTALAAVVAAGICLAMGLAMAFGVAFGDTGFAATLVGGSGFVVVLLIVAAGIALWIAARFSCTTVLLAERRSFNIVAAMRDSWSLTWEDEWRIMRYLALLGFGVALLAASLVALLAVGLASALEAGSIAPEGPGILALQMLVGIPAAYLAVMVPAGIYRELAGAPAPVEIFA